MFVLSPARYKGSRTGVDMRRAVPDIRTPLPGPNAAAIIARDAAVVSPSYTRDYPLVIASGEGCSVEDVDGNLFLDCPRALRSPRPGTLIPMWSRPSSNSPAA